MKVVFDGICFGDGPITGVGRAFVTALAAYAERHRDDMLLALPDDVPVPDGLVMRTARVARAPVARRAALRSLVRRERADVVHSSVAAVPWPCPCPTVATVHDLPWLQQPPVEPIKLGARLASAVALHSATAIVVPSRFTAAQVARSSAAAAQRTRVIPHGVALPAEPAPLQDLRGPFLVLGDDRPRKNRERTSAAHALALQRCPDLPALRFVGPPHGYVDEPRKIQLLRESRGLLHLSLLEGFGLPVLEAMAHGVPVLASNTTAIPEVAGDAALLVDPTDVDAIANAIVRLHQDDALRVELHRRGRERAAAFPPGTVATSWRLLHEELLR